MKFIATYAALALCLVASQRAFGEAPSFTKVPKETAVPRCGVMNHESWAAWNDLRPPPPNAVHVVGSVQVTNPGIDVKLTKTIPQGFNPQILLLDLELTQKPGMWPQVLTWKQVRYESLLADAKFTHSEISCGTQVLKKLEVVDAH